MAKKEIDERQLFLRHTMKADGSDWKAFTYTMWFRYGVEWKDKEDIKA